jgi:hypothetical protein
VNAVEDVTSTSTTGSPAGATCSDNLQIARRETTGSNLFMNGTVDEVACYSAVLTPTRITAHYNAGITTAFGQSFPFSVKRDPLPQLKPWSPKEWFLSVGMAPANGSPREIRDGTSVSREGSSMSSKPLRRGGSASEL